MRDPWISYSNVMPISANTYVNKIGETSPFLKALPFHKRELTEFRKITIPILGIIGDSEEKEFTAIPLDEAIELLRKENKNCTVHKIKNCNHEFIDHEEELAELVLTFIKQLP